MKPAIHAENSAKKFGGAWTDYMHIHDFMDSSKAHFPDMRHRALLHHSFGIYLCEQVFGQTFDRASDGKRISTRDVAEQHVLEDMHTIPTVADYMYNFPMLDWLGIPKDARVEISLVD